MKKVPFNVSRVFKTDLIQQVSEGLRHAIVTGYYKEGDILPSFNKMAELLGVSEIVTRRAVQQLAREGLVCSRPRIGIRVCGSQDKGWRGQVLYLHRARPDIFYHSLFSGELKEGLRNANFLVRSVFVSDEEVRNGFPHVKVELGHRNSLVIVEGRYLKGLDAFLEEQGVSFLHIGAKISKRAAYGIGQRRSTVIPALVAHGLACGVKRILQVNFEVKEELNAAGKLRDAGFRVDEMLIAPAAGFALPGAVEFGAVRSFTHWLKTKRDSLPDLILFDDDYAARGGIVALSLAGVRIPEDVQAISWSNKGMTPGYVKLLTRIEMDGEEHGRRMAEYALRILDGKVKAGDPALEMPPKFILGETTVPLAGYK
jgi:DNA-binding LacI/PurR family transcriptional regulator